jgi:hypothetical protein
LIHLISIEGTRGTPLLCHTSTLSGHFAAGAWKIARLFRGAAWGECEATCAIVQSA